MRRRLKRTTTALLGLSLTVVCNLGCTTTVTGACGPPQGSGEPQGGCAYYRSEILGGPGVECIVGVECRSGSVRGDSVILQEDPRCGGVQDAEISIWR